MLSLAQVALVLSLLLPLVLFVIMMATHIGYLDYKLGFMTLTLNYGSKLAMIILGISGLSLLISLFMAPVRYGPWALAAVVISGAVLGGYALYDRALKTYPPIYDVSTNWDRPLSMSDKLLADRGPDALPVEDAPRVPANESVDWGGKTVASINAATCPDARTLKVRDITADQIVAMLKASHNYQVFGVAPWRVEATYQDNFYGFKSDLVIRIDPDGIDLRSVDRENPRDLGGNCRRIVAILKKLKAM
ncbi:DUF1499 domain-containing protein [Asticcacaulis sp. EMRT-3]|uniref:DUF1499 domain-containing protein n=1 Tax=Asticcacaulis sp. EMRT-3 TaxID=3040349 RepID=UPI0024AF8F4A|nr:DUF1499 domain-containing protein [Asticcacaulis sp. EMRT-3]MDI7774447.1 DUF1499 domain-containing protein [Asticcacaulis sp. EMRT-3]